MFTKKLATAVASIGLATALVLGAGAPAQAAPAAKKQTVTIVATMNGEATVTYTGNGVISQKKRTSTWTRTFTKKSYTYYSVTVSSFQGATTVGCVIKVNGKKIRNKTVKGDSFASVNCAYSTN